MNESSQIIAPQNCLFKSWCVWWITIHIIELLYWSDQSVDLNIKLLLLYDINFNLDAICSVNEMNLGIYTWKYQ